MCESIGTPKVRMDACAMYYCSNTSNSQNTRHDMHIISQLTRSGKVLPGKLIVVGIAGYLTSHIGAAAVKTFKLCQPGTVGVSIIGTDKDELGPSLSAGFDGLG